MKRVVEFFRTRFTNFNLFTRRHRTAVVGVSSLLIISLVVQQAFFNQVPEAQAALTNIRQEVNILNSYLTATSGNYATSSAIANIDPSKYSGATFYFEVVASTSAATNATVALVNSSTGATVSSVTINGTAADRYRSTSFSIGAATDYKVRINNEAVGKSVAAARIIIIQNASSITATETQIEIGSEQTYTSGTLSPLSAPKYWKYTSNNWDGSPTFYAEVTYARTVDSTVASSTTYTAAGSHNFTVPSDISGNVTVQLWGAGGGGGAATANPGAGSGGAGGQYSVSSLSGLAGQTKTVVVGAGGVAVTNSAGAVGDDSTWDSTVVVAKGGAGGAIDSGAAGAGSVTGAVGDTVYAGGNGAVGSTAGPYGGGGGEGARSTGTGGNASGATGGTGGDGGDGASGPTAKANGNPGTAPGGGASGGYTNNGGNSQGAAGGDGQAIISYNIGANATTTIVLQESDGTGDGFTGWSTKATIVSGGSASTPTRVRSGSFTPVAGRNYRIAVQEGYAGATHAIYNAKIVVEQASTPTKLEPQYLLANKTLAAGTGLQKYHTYFDTAEWTNAINTYTHQVDAANGSASVVEVATEGGSQVTGSVVTSPDNSGVSSSMTMPGTGDLDVRATTNNGDVYASRILVAVTPDTTAPTPDPYFTTAPNATTTNMVNMTSVAITDANAVSYYFDSVAGSCGGNAGTGGTDSGWQSGQVYYDTGLQVNKCYAYQVTGKDSANNVTATSTASTTYTLAATPGGMTYGSVGVTSIRIFNTENGNPASNPTTNFVVHASSSDTRWNGFYVTETAGVFGTSTSPTWLSDAQIDNLQLTGLRQDTRYDFEVVARNQNQILTATSTRTGTTTLPDISPPSPSTATFSSAPNNVSGTEINMTATLGTDDTGPISYSFTYTACGTNPGTGGTSSGWQSDDNTYSDTGLEVNKCYGYTVQMRDSLSNTGTASAPSEAYTSANTPSAPTLSAAAPTTFDVVINANGNPSNTEYAVHFGTPSPDDVTWNNQYLDGSGNPSATPVWMTKATIDAITSVNGLEELTTYYVEVKARNGDNEETSYSSQANITTTDGTAPTPNPMTFSSAPNNNGTTQMDMTATTASDPTGPVEYFFDAVTGSCGGDLGTGGTDSAWQTSTSYSDTGLEVNKCYAYTVQARDASSNTGTASGAAQAYTAASTPSAPTLGSAGETTFGITINANGNPSATQYAVHFGTPSPDDTDWNNKFLDTDGTPSDTAVWMTKATIDAITVSGLNFATTYYVEVKARNGDNEETSYSSQANITTTADLTAPTPNPPSFSSAPANSSDTAIAMTASAVSDPTGPVEYFFDAVTGSCGANLGTGGTSSSWQSDTGYSDTGLQANKCYGYTLTARDGNANTTSASAASVTYTSATVPGAPSQVSLSDESLVLSIDANGNPASNPVTYFAIQVSATSDGTWLNQYADASGNPNGSAQWLTAAQLTDFTVQGLQPDTSYTFRVKARNQDNDETAFGSTATFTTLSPIFPETRLQGGVRLQGLRIY